MAGVPTLALPSSYAGTVIEAESVETQKCEVSGAGVGSDPIGAGTPAVNTSAPATSTAPDRARAPRSTRWRAAATARPQRERRRARLARGRGRRNVHGYVHADKGGRLPALGCRAGEEHDRGLPVQRDWFPAPRRRRGRRRTAMTVRRERGDWRRFACKRTTRLATKRPTRTTSFDSRSGADHPTPMTAVGGGAYEGSYVADRSAPRRCRHVPRRDRRIGRRGRPLEGCAVLSGPPVSFEVRGPVPPTATSSSRRDARGDCERLRRERRLRDFCRG